MIVFSLIISILLIVVLTARLSVHPFLALLAATLSYGFLTRMPLMAIVTAINDGFKETVGKTGLVIVFGVIIGAFLENSGAAYVLTEKILRLIGPKRINTAMASIGWFVSIPVFADSGFLLVSPLSKSLCRKTGSPITAAAVALALGLIASHTMVPPTPGPVAAAGILNVDLGLVLLFGIPISALAVIPGIIYATKIHANSDRISTEELSDKEWNEKLSNAPGAFRSALPVVVPIFLIVLKSISPSIQSLAPPIKNAIDFLGEPFIALLGGVLFAFWLPRKLELKFLSTTGWVGNSLRDAAIIILITGAGGSFGKMLQSSDLAKVASGAIESVNIGILLPFILAAVIKTAQGSSTVAIITAASIISPLMPSLGLTTPDEKALAVVIIGAGAAVVCHANDSFFWVVTQLSGMDVRMGYKLFTPGTAVIGAAGAVITYFVYLIIH